MGKLQPLKAKEGDQVAYAKHFLKSIGCPATDRLWGLRGTVQEVHDEVAEVLWDGEAEPMSVGLTNLAHPGPNLKFCG
jgi:hypothetical protein